MYERLIRFRKVAKPVQIRSPAHVHYCDEVMAITKHNYETLCFCLVDHKGYLTWIKTYTARLQSSVPIALAEIIRLCITALRKNCRLYMVHNHPNARYIMDLYPSKADIDLTVTVMTVCTILGLEFVDHVIINGSTRLSMMYDTFTIESNRLGRLYEALRKQDSQQIIKLTVEKCISGLETKANV